MCNRDALELTKTVLGEQVGRCERLQYRVDKAAVADITELCDSKLLELFFLVFVLARRP